MTEAILAYPFRMHSEGFRKMLIDQMAFIVFCDGGIAEKRNNVWEVAQPGMIGEAEKFVCGEGL